MNASKPEELPLAGGYTAMREVKCLCANWSEVGTGPLMFSTIPSENAAAEMRKERLSDATN